MFKMFSTNNDCFRLRLVVLLAAEEMGMVYILLKMHHRGGFLMDDDVFGASSLWVWVGCVCVCVSVCVGCECMMCYNASNNA